MKLSSLISWLRSGQLLMMMRLGRLLEPCYRVNFLAGAASQGLLRRLAAGPVSLAALAAEFCPDPGPKKPWRPGSR